MAFRPWCLLRSFSSLKFSSLAVNNVQTLSEAASQPIYASCVLARAPLLKPLLEDWEIEYKTWAAEIRRRREHKLPYTWEKAKKAAYDDEDARAVSHWEPVSRTTEADEKSDTKSLMRCLDRFLFFLIRSNNTWQFPSAENREGETIRQTAERALVECLGSDADVFFIANWPIAHVAFEETTSRVEYYMKAQLLSGEPSLIRSSDEDYAWVAKSELDRYFTHAKQIDVLSKALP